MATRTGRPRRVVSINSPELPTNRLLTLFRLSCGMRLSPLRLALLYWWCFGRYNGDSVTIKNDAAVYPEASAALYRLLSAGVVVDTAHGLVSNQSAAAGLDSPDLGRLLTKLPRNDGRLLSWTAVAQALVSGDRLTDSSEIEQLDALLHICGRLLAQHPAGKCYSEAGFGRSG